MTFVRIKMPMLKGPEDKPKIWKQHLIWFVVGFLFYPLIFIPLFIHLAPGLMEQWIYVFAEYLRLWGI